MLQTKETQQLTSARLIEQMTADEQERAAHVEQVLPALCQAAEAVDQSGEFYRPHVETLRQAQLMGLLVPEQYGGLGGGLRDLAGATFAMGTACPSTALAYFFHNSSVSRGLLAIEAAEAGLFSDEEAAVVHDFGEKVLCKMGQEKMLLGNFASETVKSSQSAVFISTEARPTEGGWLVSGTKSFGCNTGVADEYLVTAKVAGIDGADGIALFFVPREREGVNERPVWNAMGMRGTASHGIVLDDVFVPQEEALTVPGAFVKMMSLSRGSLLGYQCAISAIYLGVAQRTYDFALEFTTNLTFHDTGKPIATSPFHQELFGKMTVDLETGYLWLRRQIELESSDPPLLPKAEVLKQWRMAKGQIAEAAYRVVHGALKACGTSNTGHSGVISRALRDIAMGQVMGFPMERGRLEVAKMVTEGREQTIFGV